MSKEVLILPKAEISLQPILDYLIQKWSIQVHNDFLDDTLKVIHQISTHPKSFPLYKKNQIRKALINQYIALFYLEKETTIEVLLFWNMIQDAKKLKL